MAMKRSLKGFSASLWGVVLGEKPQNELAESCPLMTWACPLLSAGWLDLAFGLGSSLLLGC